MHLGTRLRRILAMMTVLISLLAGLGVASAQEDAPIPSGEGGRQTPRAADGTSASLHSNATDTPLSSPSPIQTTTPLSPTPSTLSSTAGTPDSTAPAPAESADKTEDQASHTVLFDPADSSKPTHASVKTGTLAAAPQQNPQREGFRFEGWTLDGRPYDFQTPVLQDTTLKARWTKVTDWTLSPDHGPATGARLTISPPDRQEPQIASIQAAGNQIAGLTGDGRIYTWTQDSTPVQFPLPTHAADGFRYLQAAAGSHRQAALGSDQRIYTWNSGQATPTILDTGQDTKFTSIGMNDNRLLAVDQQGQAHAYQTRDAGSQEPNPKFTKQAETSLPGKAQAVTAIASPGRILIVDADGQAWTWETANTGSAKPARIKQDPGMRIIQAHALNQGFLLLDTERRIRYLADNTTSPTAVNLPANIKTNSITANDSQAVITDTEGHVWSWQPGEAPMRADDGNKRYMQAASTGSRITAIDRQGSMFTWDVDGQGQPGKPARVSTTTASILESASLNGQPLNLTKNNDAWQTDMPASKPGPTTVLIVGRQDGQPFTKNLNYTVDQPLTRGAEPRSTFTVHFDTGGGNPEPADQNVSTPNGRVKRPSPDPAREGYLFDGWFTGEVAYDFSKPVTKSLTLTARWTFKDPDNTWKINPDQGSRLGNETTTITPPDTSRGIRFTQVSGSMYDSSISYGFSLAVGSDGNAWAWGSNYYGQLGIDKPDQRNTPAPVPKPADTPMDFTYVQVSAGSRHSLALGSDGNAYAWGENSKGQIGDGTTTRRTTPVKVMSPADTPADFTYTQVSGGNNYSLAVGSDGNAYAWGSNQKGVLGINIAIWWGDTNPAPMRVRDPSSPKDKSKGLQAEQVSAGYQHSLAVGSDGNAYAWGDNENGQLGNDSIPTGQYNSKAQNPAPVPVSFNLQLVITGVRFDQTPASGLTRGDGSSVTVTTSAHAPGTVTVNVDYTLGGAPKTPDTSLQYTYLPAGVLPNAGGEGILLALATGMTGMGGVLASRRHRRETHSLSLASHG